MGAPQEQGQLIVNKGCVQGVRIIDVNRKGKFRNLLKERSCVELASVKKVVVIKNVSLDPQLMPALDFLKNTLGFSSYNIGNRWAWRSMYTGTCIQMM